MDLYSLLVGFIAGLIVAVLLLRGPEAARAASRDMAAAADESATSSTTGPDCPAAGKATAPAAPVKEKDAEPHGVRPKSLASAAPRSPPSPAFSPPRSSEVKAYIESADVAVAMLCAEAWATEWSHIGTEHDVKLYRKQSSGGEAAVHSFKGSATLPVPAESLFEALRDFEFRKKCDRMLKDITLIAELDERTQVLRMRFQAKQCLLATAREFVVVQRAQRDPDGTLCIAATSIEWRPPLWSGLPECAATKDAVRGHVSVAGWIVRPAASEDSQQHSKVTYIAEVDTKFSIPSSVVNLVARKQPLCIHYAGLSLTGRRR